MSSYTITNEQLMQMIESHIREPLSVKYLSDHFGYSEFHFCRIFKKQMGISIMDYISQRRIMMASEAIISGTNIIDAAIEFGWESHSGFSKAFKKVYGFTPSLLKALTIELYDLGGRMNMKDIFLIQTDPHAGKQELTQILKEIMVINQIQEIEKIEKMIVYADRAYTGLKRYSGDEYITHLLNVAIILAQLETDADTIAASLFCDITKKSEITLDELLANLPMQIQSIIREVSEVENLEDASDTVLLIKAAERLHNMRTIEFMEESARKGRVRETIELFMPIARRIENCKLMSELNALSSKYLYDYTADSE